MPETLFTSLANLGAVGIIAALAIWQVFYLTKKLIQVIENNTRAMTELKEHCKKSGSLNSTIHPYVGGGYE